MMPRDNTTDRGDRWSCSSATIASLVTGPHQSYFSDSTSHTRIVIILSNATQAKDAASPFRARGTTASGLDQPPASSFPPCPPALASAYIPSRCGLLILLAKPWKDPFEGLNRKRRSLRATSGGGITCVRLSLHGPEVSIEQNWLRSQTVI